MAFVPARLAEARKALNDHGRQVSQDRFAERIGVSKRSIERWESGTAEPRMEQLALIAEGTGKPIGFFFDSDSAPLPSDQREMYADLLEGVAAEIQKAAERVRAGETRLAVAS